MKSFSRKNFNIPGATRRKSVFAEGYDPEAEEDSEDTSVIYPKTDLQRRTLKEAVKEILLFRSLEFEQLNEILNWNIFDIHILYSTASIDFYSRMCSVEMYWVI